MECANEDVQARVDRGQSIADELARLRAQAHELRSRSVSQEPPDADVPRLHGGAPRMTAEPLPPNVMTFINLVAAGELAYDIDWFPTPDDQGTCDCPKCQSPTLYVCDATLCQCHPTNDFRTALIYDACEARQDWLVLHQQIVAACQEAKLMARHPRLI